MDECLINKKISVIIPTLNESRYLPRLLKSLRNQTLKDFEVIVADAGSHDSTREIAEIYGARVVQGGLPGVGRNAGARDSLGEFLFFIDADVTVPGDFLEKAYFEMQEKFYDLASCRFKPLSSQLVDRFIHSGMYLILKVNHKINPMAFGFCIISSKRLFERVNGFDETVILAEDCDFVKRASKFRPLEFLRSTYIRVSVRRFVKEGRLNYLRKGIRISFHRTFKGEIRDNSIEYEFGKFSK